MKIIFLDIDGVIAPYPAGSTGKPGGRARGKPRPDRIATRSVMALNSLTYETRARIAIVSSWRHRMRPERLLGILRYKGVLSEVELVPVREDMDRELEVRGWLTERRPEAWCVVDDDPLHELHGLDPFVVRPRPERGFRAAEAEACRRLLVHGAPAVGHDTPVIAWSK